MFLPIVKSIKVECVQNLYVHKGKPTHTDYKQAQSAVGKTVEAEAEGKIDNKGNAFHNSPCSVLLFNDGTAHAYIHPQDKP
jgi:hypothetical protein